MLHYKHLLTIKHIYYLYVLDLLVLDEGGGEHVPKSVRVNTLMVQRPFQDIGNDPTQAIFGPQRETN